MVSIVNPVVSIVVNKQNTDSKRMKLASKHLCSGCTACSAICPVSAITMLDDHEGFKYPDIDSNTCTHCGLCEQVCPVLHPNPAREPLAVYAAKCKDDELRMRSSSGGMFTLLAQQVLNDGGVVFGAGWNPDWRVVHKAVETEEGLADLRGSKYVQSDMGDTFKQVKGFLESGRRVLFSGTPCQVAGIQEYLANTISQDNPYREKLLLVDFICHAVPSPKVFALYLQDKVFQYKGNPIRILFRDKIKGWKNFSFSIEFDNGEKYNMNRGAENFYMGFYQDIFNRPSCANCSFRSLRSGSDVTIADYWNVQKKFSGFDDDKGVSLVMANTEEGALATRGGLFMCEYIESDFFDVKAKNCHVFASPKPHPKRDDFFKVLNHENFEHLVNRLLKPAFHKRWRWFLGRLKRKVLG